jgi:hypothetical protein
MDYLILETSIILRKQDGSYYTGKTNTKIDSVIWDNTSEEGLKKVLQRESEFASHRCINMINDKLKNIGGLKSNVEQVKKEIEQKFSKAFKGFTLELTINNGEIVVFGYRHDDWFIVGEGANPKYPKYPKIEIVHPKTSKNLTAIYTHAYRVCGDLILNVCQGNIYYKGIGVVTNPPITSKELRDFCDDLPYDIELCNWGVSELPEIED